MNAPRQLALDRFGNLYVASSTTVRLVENVDGDADADGDDRVVTLYGGGDRARFPENASSCLQSLALADDGDRFKRGVVVHRLLQLLPSLPVAARPARARGGWQDPGHRPAQAGLP